ncbi:hypothetical protein S83_038844 [Arachis hypogaea]
MPPRKRNIKFQPRSTSNVSTEFLPICFFVAFHLLNTGGRDLYILSEPQRILEKEMSCFSELLIDCQIRLQLFWKMAIKSVMRFNLLTEFQIFVLIVSGYERLPNQKLGGG